MTVSLLHVFVKDTYSELNHKEMLDQHTLRDMIGNKLPFIFKDVKDIRLKERQNFSKMTKKT